MIKPPLKALFDLSVLMDALNDTPESDGASNAALAQARHGAVEGYVSAGAIESLYDLQSRNLGARAARDQMRELRGILAVAPVNAAVVDAALALGWPYLDDALAHECARVNGLDCLVTLNAEDIPGRSIAVWTPDDLPRMAMVSGLRVANG